MRNAAYILLGMTLGIFVVLRLDVDHRLWVHTPQTPTLDTVAKFDTIVIHDTVRLPIETTRYLTRIDTVWLTPVVHRDTTTTNTPIAVEVPIEQKEYQGNGWQAWVSGYHTTLDSLTLDRPTITIEREVTHLKQKHWGWQIGLGLSIDHHAKPSPALYAGFGYTF